MPTQSRKYTPRNRPAAQQMPLMAEVNELAETAPEPVRLDEAIQLFAQGIGMVEALARLNQPELIMQMARIAYTRARQVERGEQPGTTGGGQ